MPADHQECADTLRAGMAPIDVTISTLPPLVPNPFTDEPFVCPHGVIFWMEPTGEQLAAWASPPAR